MNDELNIESSAYEVREIPRSKYVKAYDWPPPIVDIDPKFGLWIQMNFYPNSSA